MMNFIKRKLDGALVGFGTGMAKLGMWMNDYPTTMIITRSADSPHGVKMEVYTEIPDNARASACLGLPFLSCFCGQILAHSLPVWLVIFVLVLLLTEKHALR